MSLISDLLFGFETHSPERIRAALAGGLDPQAPIQGKPPVWWLVEMYFRSPRFAECLKIMRDAGATIQDPVLEAVLLDDPSRLPLTPEVLGRTVAMPCAYTSLDGASVLHVCAEYNSVNCARALIGAGMDVNVRAAVDGEGIGGHTPLFHTVNSNGNHCRPMMDLLVDAGADLDLRLKGVVWGGGFEWETVVFDITPISYAQCGLYAQFHRKEQDIYSNIAYLYHKRYGTEAPVRNVPNRYLKY